MRSLLLNKNLGSGIQFTSLLDFNLEFHQKLHPENVVSDQ